MSAVTIPTRTLRNGALIPALGFGTYPLLDDDAHDAVATAIEVGYREIDTSRMYQNEEPVGRAIRHSGVPRDELFVTSKITRDQHGYDNALEGVSQCLDAMGLDHLDMMLIHWPNPDLGLFPETFAGLLDARNQGLVRGVGVSNFLPHHLDAVKKETGEYPLVNQIQLNPAFSRSELRYYDEEAGILTQSWSPLDRVKHLFDTPEILEIARAHGRTPVQTVLRWHLELDLMPIVKSVHRDRMIENAQVFDFALSRQEIATMLRLDDGTFPGADPETTRQ